MATALIIKTASNNASTSTAMPARAVSNAETRKGKVHPQL